MSRQGSSFRLKDLLESGFLNSSLRSARTPRPGIFTMNKNGVDDGT